VFDIYILNIWTRTTLFRYSSWMEYNWSVPCESWLICGICDHCRMVEDVIKGVD